MLLVTCLVWVGFYGVSEVSAWQRNIRFEHLSTEQGLSHVFVHSIAQDQQGFMWFGAANGLNKFDGYRVSVYKNDPNDPTSISDGPVNELFVDHDGVLWAGGSALHRFDREKNNFTRFTHDPDDPDSLSEDSVISIFEDHEGILWVGTWNGGLNRFDRASNSFTRFQHDPEDQNSLPAGAIRAIYESDDGVLWVGSYNRGESANLSHFNRQTGAFQPVLSCSATQSSCAHPVTVGFI